MSLDPDQQPIQRTVGRRQARSGRPLTPEDRAALASLARYRTRAPKGVFIYHSADEMDSDRLRWTVDAVVRATPLTTEYTRPATWEDVKTLARYLDDLQVEYALVGGYALAAHGFNRFTEYIDTLVNPSAENSRKWIVALSRLPDAAAAELAAEGDVFADDRRYAIRINDEFTIDVMPSIAGLSWEEMKQHISTTRVDDADIRILDLSGLLKTKQGTRPKDQMDAAVIAAALERRGR